MRGGGKGRVRWRERGGELKEEMKGKGELGRE